MLQKDVAVLKAERQKLRDGMERMIDSLAAGLIDKDQFTSHVSRAKARIVELDAKIASRAAHDERHAHVRAVMSRLAELSAHLQSQLKNADWTTKREIIRAVVQRIEIGSAKVAVVLRLPTETSPRGVEPIIVTLPRHVNASAASRRGLKPTTGDRNST